MAFLAYVKKLLYLCTLINFRNIDLDPLRRGLFIVLYSLCMLFICAQEVLVLPYEATGLTEEQKAMNPERLAYPTELKETIKSEVSFECTPQEMELGPFSVSATKQVVFSPGNLQFNAAKGSHSCADGSTQPGTWRFAEHQWDYVGDATNGTVYENGVKCDNAKISSTYNGWIDMFGWGTSGWNSGAKEYQPYSSSLEHSSDYYPGGYEINNLTGGYAKADWGVYNQIGNTSPGTWRILTMEEFLYLFHGRPNAAQLLGFGTVNGVQGTIILPDNWETPEGITFSSAFDKGVKWVGEYFKYENSKSDNFSHNIYTSAQWDKLESKGAVFLPEAGCRHETTVKDALTVGGNYWTATYASSSTVHSLSFYDYALYLHSSQSPWAGNSVRLVKEIH